jgi:hypothetical protein
MLCRYFGLTFFILLFAVSTAKSGELQGSFTGLAIDSKIGPFPPLGFLSGSNFDGTEITGTFDFNVSSAIIGVPTPTYYEAGYFVGESRLTFNILGSSSLAETYSFDLTSPSIGAGFLGDATAQGNEAGNEQTLEIDSEIGNSHYFTGSLRLTAFDLFDLANPSNLSSATIDYASPNTFGHIFEHLTFETDVQLTSVTFDIVPAPEPPAILDLICGVAGLAAVRLRSKVLS